MASYRPRWINLEQEERTRLGMSSGFSQLGQGAVLGGRIYDAQHNIGVGVGPLTLNEYERFLPGERSLARLSDWMRNVLSEEQSVDVTLTLRASEVPQACLGKQGRLGFTTWIGTRRSTEDASDLTFRLDRIASVPRAASASSSTVE